MITLISNIVFNRINETLVSESTILMEANRLNLSIALTALAIFASLYSVVNRGSTEQTAPSEESLEAQAQLSHIMEKLRKIQITNGKGYETENPTEDSCRKASVTLRNILMEAHQTKTSYDNNLALILKHGKQGINDQAGVCDTCAAIILFEISKIPSWNYHVELMGNKQHAFLAVNRQEMTDPNNPTSWNKDAFIVDLWSQNLFHENGIKSSKEDLKNFREGLNSTLYKNKIWVRGKWTADQIKQASRSQQAA